MLKSVYRLKKPLQFKKVYSRGRSVAGRWIVLYWLPNKSEKINIKIGFSVSKKVGKAVVRNRMKRILRACIKNHIPFLKNVNLIFIAKARITQSSYLELDKEMKYLLAKARLI